MIDSLPGKSLFYQHVAAAAESGWDFSSRWLDTATSPFPTIRTQEIVPVDLNAYLCAQEFLLGEFNDIVGEYSPDGSLMWSVSDHTLFAWL